MEPQTPSGAEIPGPGGQEEITPTELSPSKEQTTAAPITERSGDTGSQRVAGDPAVVPAPVPTEPVNASITSDQNPAIADDVDVIEKEWVDRAKEVIAEHKDDPWTEEEAVEDLQIDYLKKRYGKDLDKPNKEG